ncbi:DUF1800 domain-containing protein [Hansschlegelia zhihuaiae]|uniref:DUF1800 domain-containing protein n=1 Tax=Hansschlegelia zhihuaiae TaxID=405005 RepID=A0A4Q0MIE7_9HYPH|nr:DUF1800 domain-containing protein [Hansschlegelia zhihuaiae]RXF73254.1 DUF1800 domain-containing protein [Hansschlegelia zhihuaiae]
MALSPAKAKLATLAFNRFGLGAKPGGLAKIGKNPLNALKRELATPDIALIPNENGDLPGYAKACQEGVAAIPDMAEINRANELKARFAKHIAVDIGYVERLVLFWSNHFSMLYSKSTIIKSTIGQWERDVVRKHVLGKFSDMLVQTIQHPAMIKYLDNDRSTGPVSPRGVSNNENLARELLELHTMGLGAYTQDDVQALALMLTGWTFQRDAQASDAGQFYFRPEWHQPGPQTFLGKNYPAGGLGQATAALVTLAKRPETGRNIARKLVRHFIMDEPTDGDEASMVAFEAMVAQLAKVFIDTGGDLAKMSVALLDLPGAWVETPGKFRRPYEYLVAQMRALNDYRALDKLMNPEGDTATRLLKGMFQPTWGWPTPDGYPDEDLHWMNPNAMAFRLDAAQQVARTVTDGLDFDPAVFANKLYGKALSTTTAERVAHAGSLLGGLTILFVSPEFQKR